MPLCCVLSWNINSVAPVGLFGTNDLDEVLLADAVLLDGAVPLADAVPVAGVVGVATAGWEVALVDCAEGEAGSADRGLSGWDRWLLPVVAGRDELAASGWQPVTELRMTRQPSRHRHLGAIGQ